MAGKHNATGGMPVRRVSRTFIEKHATPGRAGLWSGTGNTYFDNSRVMRTIDPSEYEQDLGMGGRTATAWCTPLRENNKGRVIV